MSKYQSKSYSCHFCGRSDSLNALEQLNVWVCSKCWEIIALIASKWYAAGAKILHSDFAEAEAKLIASLSVNSEKDDADI